MDAGNKALNELVQRGNAGQTPMSAEVSKIGTYLILLTDNVRKELARMSLWHDFPPTVTKFQHDAGLLSDLVRRSLLQSTGSRYSMHVLIREAARELLHGHAADDPGLLLSAKEHFLRALAAVGDQAAAATREAGGLLAARQVLHPELANCSSCCSMPDAYVQDERLVHGLVCLCNSLRDCGFYAELAAVLQQVNTGG